MFERQVEEAVFGKRAAPQELPAHLKAAYDGIDPALRGILGLSHDQLLAAIPAAESIRKGVVAAPADDPIETFVKTQARKASGLPVADSPSALADLNFSKLFDVDPQLSRFGSGVELSVRKCADEQREGMLANYFTKRHKTELQVELGRLVEGHRHLFDSEDSDLAEKALKALDLDALLKICRAARERVGLAA